MATNHTEKYGLNLWEPGDAFLREEFNENTQKTEAALNTKGNCRILFGTYIGTGTYGPNKPNTLDFADTMGKAPAVFFVGWTGMYHSYVLRGMDLVFLDPTHSSTRYRYFGWTDTGLSWFSYDSAEDQLNKKDVVYYYCGLFD